MEIFFLPKFIPQDALSYFYLEVLLFKKSEHLWVSSGQFEEAEYIIFCYVFVSIRLLLSAESEAAFILLST